MFSHTRIPTPPSTRSAEKTAAGLHLAPPTSPYFPLSSPIDSELELATPHDDAASFAFETPTSVSDAVSGSGEVATVGVVSGGGGRSDGRLVTATRTESGGAKTVPRNGSKAMGGNENTRANADRNRLRDKWVALNHTASSNRAAAPVYRSRIQNGTRTENDGGIKTAKKERPRLNLVTDFGIHTTATPRPQRISISGSRVESRFRPRSRSRSRSRSQSRSRGTLRGLGLGPTSTRQQHSLHKPVFLEKGDDGNLRLVGESFVGLDDILALSREQKAVLRFREGDVGVDARGGKCQNPDRPSPPPFPPAHQTNMPGLRFTASEAMSVFSHFSPTESRDHALRKLEGRPLLSGWRRRKWKGKSIERTRLEGKEKQREKGKAKVESEALEERGVNSGLNNQEMEGYHQRPRGTGTGDSVMVTDHQKTLPLLPSEAREHLATGQRPMMIGLGVNGVDGADSPPMTPWPTAEVFAFNSRTESQPESEPVRSFPNKAPKQENNPRPPLQPMAPFYSPTPRTPTPSTPTIVVTPARKQSFKESLFPRDASRKRRPISDTYLQRGESTQALARAGGEEVIPPVPRIPSIHAREGKKRKGTRGDEGVGEERVNSGSTDVEGHDLSNEEHHQDQDQTYCYSEGKYSIGATNSHHDLSDDLVPLNPTLTNHSDARKKSLGLTIDTLIARPQSKGWWTYLLSPFSAKSTGLKSPALRSPKPGGGTRSVDTWEKTPVVSDYGSPAVSLGGKELDSGWLDDFNEKGSLPDLEKRGPGLAVTTELDDFQKDEPVSVVSPDTPCDDDTQNRTPKSIGQAINFDHDKLHLSLHTVPIVMSTAEQEMNSKLNSNPKIPPVRLISSADCPGRAEEYYQACFHDLVSDKSYFQCIGHVCSYNKNSHQRALSVPLSYSMPGTPEPTPIEDAPSRATGFSLGFESMPVILADSPRNINPNNPFFNSKKNDGEIEKEAGRRDIRTSAVSFIEDEPPIPTARPLSPARPLSKISKFFGLGFGHRFWWKENERRNASALPPLDTEAGAGVWGERVTQIIDSPTWSASPMSAAKVKDKGMTHEVDRQDEEAVQILEEPVKARTRAASVCLSSPSPPPQMSAIETATRNPSSSSSRPQQREATLIGEKNKAITNQKTEPFSADQSPPIPPPYSVKPASKLPLPRHLNLPSVDSQSCRPNQPAPPGPISPLGQAVLAPCGGVPMADYSNANAELNIDPDTVDFRQHRDGHPFPYSTFANPRPLYPSAILAPSTIRGSGIQPGITITNLEAAHAGEARRQRHERSDAAWQRAGGLWCGRGCVPKAGYRCFGWLGRGGPEGRRRRRVFLLVVVLVTVIVLVTSLATALTRKGKDVDMGHSGWLNLTGYPPMPTGKGTADANGAMAIAGMNNVVADTSCVTPRVMWSCALPHEQQGANAPFKPDQPQFLIAVLFQNGTNFNHSTVPRNETKGRRRLGSGKGGKRKRWLRACGLKADPAPPSLPDQIFLGNTTDNISAPHYAGEPTPFYASFLDFFSDSVSSFSSNNTLTRRGSVADSDNNRTDNSNSSSDSGSGSIFPNLTEIIPDPPIRSDGSAAPAILYPFPTYQPVRLYNRGQNSEHYGFYTYFDRSIFLNDISANRTSNGAATTDDNGGVKMGEARYRCTWSQTRFRVQIWTHGGRVVSWAKPSIGRNHSSPKNTSASSFPYPITVTLDRHGGNDKKLVYCYGLQHENGKTTTNLDVRKLQLENLAAGGSLVHPGKGLYNLTMSGDENSHGGKDAAAYGGIDGGMGGCQCEWQNWVEH